MKDHALLFSGLAVLFVFAMVVAAVVATDPTRGLLLGVIPILAALVTWALTNRSGYPNRAPVSLPHERPATGDPPVETWDPFERERPTLTEPEPAPLAQTEPGDPFDAKAEATSKPSGDTAPPNPTEAPSSMEAKDKQESRSTRAELTPPVEKASATRTSKKRRRQKPASPPAAEQSASKPPPAAPTEPGPETEGASEKPAPAKGQRNRRASSPGSSPEPESSDSSPEPAADSETPHESLSPAEVAIRDAEARKRRKRKGTPTEVT